MEILLGQHLQVMQLTATWSDTMQNDVTVHMQYVKEAWYGI